jgi:hypothetical protein
VDRKPDHQSAIDLTWVLYCLGINSCGNKHYDSDIGDFTRRMRHRRSFLNIYLSIRLSEQ